MSTFRNCFAFACLLVFLSPSAFALSQSQAFALLRDSGENMTVVGTICEQVARLELMKDYPENRYAITNGIAYGRNRATEGELDVVVFEKPTMKAVLVGEVKCWSNFNSAKNKANKQRSRFLSVIGTGDDVNLWATKNGQHYSKSQFASVTNFISISSEGADRAGFDMALEMDLQELMELRQQIMSCQANGSCRKAN
ncbi:MAG: hypothetical protein AB7K68_09535 [Bacteriovoracia bacterium]